MKKGKLVFLFVLSLILISIPLLVSAEIKQETIITPEKTPKQDVPIKPIDESTTNNPISIPIKETQTTFVQEVSSNSNNGNSNEDIIIEEPSSKTKSAQTYAECMNEIATTKKNCYKSIKTIYSICKKSNTKTITCTNNYRKALKQCQNDFTTTKKYCSKIKHSIFQTFKYGWK